MCRASSSVAFRVKSALLGVLVCGAVVTFLSSSAVAASPTNARGPVPCSAPPCEVAASAQAFVDSLGLNVSIEDRLHFEKVVSLLADLKIRHVRVGMFRDQNQKEFLGRIASRGISLTLITSFASTVDELRNQLLALSARPAGGFVEALEGINEPNNPAMPWYLPNWPEHTRNQQRTLWRAREIDPSQPSPKIIGPSVCCNFNDQKRLGNIANVIDFGNIHDYFGVQNPGALYYTGANIIDVVIKAESSISEDRPVIATETGWGSSPTDDAGGIDENTQAKYIARVFFEHWLHGISRTFVYDFVDGRAKRPFYSFGIIRQGPNNTLIPKRAYYMLQELCNTLADNLSNAKTAGLSFTISGDTRGVEHLLLQKSDGSFFLAVWVETSSWDKTTRLPRRNVPQKVELRFSTPVDHAELLEFPMTAEKTHRSPLIARGNSVDFDVTDGIQLVHFLLSNRPPTTLAPPTSAEWTIKNANSNLCFFLVNASLDGGTKIAQHACALFSNERFALQANSSDPQTIENAYSRNCLEQASPEDGAALRTSVGCRIGDPKSQFALTQGGDGSVAIVNQSSRLCVAVPGRSLEEGAQLVMSMCDKADRSQAWILSAVKNVVERPH